MRPRSRPGPDSPPPLSKSPSQNGGLTRRSGATSHTNAATTSNSGNATDGDFDDEANRQRRIAEAKEILAQRWRNWHVRSVWSLVMIAAFAAILCLGHAWVVALVTVIHTLVYWEVISIAWVPSRAKRMPWFRTMTWYFLLSTNYFLYGQTVIQYFKQNGFVDSPLATHHSFVSFLLYCIGLVFFVFNLQKDHYKFQFSQFAWTHMTLMLVVVQSQFIWWMAQYQYLICPVDNLRTSYWSGLECSPNPVFLVRELVIPEWISRIVLLAPFQFHAVIMALFARFFASGAKRAFKIKDFGDYIPGHGGITDRMDCQFLMSFFAFLYYQSFVAIRGSTIESVVESVLSSGLGDEGIREVVRRLNAVLEKGDDDFDEKDEAKMSLT
ncbi:hypothetical protein BCR33DRAFT_712411 [Rhizoclosmatium globosum]|uniref:phosphatidate cytidylyltransferase n=1 Tax=Rhizoclosmatium globosum TaxID=329046 RepID=A0A1Y2CWR0_9FUNG|nr:hypothetical protein BCR33DRAFT_712411 [Rhizoclosmatium globosum]|eukprot:ORY51316.1 hypothetical protein BCR33DRAFT_712411 [Rhizoclosmatium globosum]